MPGSQILMRTLVARGQPDRVHHGNTHSSPRCRFCSAPTVVPLPDRAAAATAVGLDPPRFPTTGNEGAHGTRWPVQCGAWGSVFVDFRQARSGGARPLRRFGLCRLSAIDRA